MDLIKFEASHYPIISSWFEEYGWTPPALDCLPRNGLIAVSGEKMICAGFCYYTDSRMAFMDWIVADKNAAAADRKDAVKSVISGLISKSREDGFKILYTVTSNTHMINVYKNIGLSEMESGAITLALSLDSTINNNFLR